MVSFCVTCLCLYVCVSHVSVCLCVSHVCVCLCLSVFIHVCQNVCLSAWLYVCITCLCLSVCLCVHVCHMSVSVSLSIKDVLLRSNPREKHISSIDIFLPQNHHSPALCSFYVEPIKYYYNLPSIIGLQFIQEVCN